MQAYRNMQHFLFICGVKVEQGLTFRFYIGISGNLGNCDTLHIRGHFLFIPLLLTEAKAAGWDWRLTADFDYNHGIKFISTEKIQISVQ